MSATIHLGDHLLTRARRLHQAGQSRHALALLDRVATFADRAADAHALVGEIHLKRRRYRHARRHLLQAARLEPDVARHRFLLGLAWQHDPNGDPARAERHYRRSLALNPQQPRCLGEAGLLAIADGRHDQGLTLLRRAVRLAPTDASVVGRLARGLVQAGKPDEARTVVRTAMFASSRCPRLRQLWYDHQLMDLRREQETATAANNEPPVLLPFLRVVHENQDAQRPVRADHARCLPGPHFLRVRARAGHRRAP